MDLSPFNMNQPIVPRVVKLLLGLPGAVTLVAATFCQVLKISFGSLALRIYGPAVAQTRVDWKDELKVPASDMSAEDVFQTM